MSNPTTVISYPIPAYQNVPIHAEYYLPSRFVISAISLGSTTTITATTSMNYAIGQEIRLLIPPTFGCRQLNNQTGFVISRPMFNQVIVTIDSSQNVDLYKASSSTTVAQILAIGDVNTGITNDHGDMHEKTFIPGSFINISPR